MTYQLTTLSNGMRVATERLEGLETAAVSVAVDVGSRYEAEGDGGVSHMLEHMAFKGTKRRNARQIAEEMDDIGGNLNAYTSLEHTVYYARVLKEDLTIAVDVIADILQNSIFDEEELARERQVILQELAMHHDTPDDLIFDIFHETAYPDQPLGRSILGEPERVATFSREDMVKYIQNYYHPSRMVLSAAGNIDHDRLVRLAETHFAMPASNPQIAPQPGRYVGGDTRRTHDLEQLHLILGFGGLSVHDPDYQALQLFSSILGGGMSSRLFQEVREKRGLAYNVQSMVSAYSDNGLLGIYVATTGDQTGELIKILCGEMRGLAERVTTAELRRAKNQQKAGLLMARESASSVAEWIGRHQLIYGRYLPASEIIARIDAVTEQDIGRVAARLLASGPPTLSALGPVDTLDDYATIQDMLC